ncbi:MAG: hypothetical protein AB8B77_06240 [Alphaproteobacteria bacterium]
MKASISYFLVLSGIFFLIFFLNVVMGSLKMPTFLPDIAEMLLLFAACILFVIGVLRIERAHKSSK